MHAYAIAGLVGTLAAATLIGGGLAVHHVSGPLTYSRPDATRELGTSTSTPLAPTSTPAAPALAEWPPELDRAAYDRALLSLADYPDAEAFAEAAAAAAQARASTSSPTSTAPSTDPAPVPYAGFPPPSQLIYSSSTNVSIPGRDWPAAAPYPHGGAILPFHRVVAYYGNFYSTRMGILGEFASSTVLARLASTSAAWEAADPDTPVMPAIHYIAMVAQGDAGSDGMYRNVMPDAHIERAYDMTQAIDGIMFLDLQVGLSTIERELPQFRSYFTRPDVHLAIDPEFSMKDGTPPGLAIGTYTAADINFTIDWLSEIVREHELPPKILVVHRFTTNMVQDYAAIKPTPEVQVVIHMDGWGSRDLKRSTYRRVVEPEPVQFAGLKIFYKNDLKPPSTGLFSPEEALELHPEPVYIQYQ